MTPFCTLCGNTNEADLGKVIGICLDKDACHQRQYALAKKAGAREERERIAKLAEQTHATCTVADPVNPSRLFADLLRNEEPW